MVFPKVQNDVPLRDKYSQQALVALLGFYRNLAKNRHGDERL